MGPRLRICTVYPIKMCWWVCFALFNLDITRQTSNISHTLVGSMIVDHSDVVGASPAEATPTTSSFST